jgi:hypothetical protein
MIWLWFQNTTEYCGQAPSAPLYIREVPGSNPGAAWSVVGFFRSFPTTSHRGMSIGLISQIRRMLGQYLPLNTFLPHPSSPHPSRNCLSMQKALESLSSPLPFGGEWKMCLFVSTTRTFTVSSNRASAF